MAKKTKLLIAASTPANIPKQQLGSKGYVVSGGHFSKSFLEKKCSTLTEAQLNQLFANPQFCTEVVSCVTTWLGNAGVSPVVAAEICTYLNGLSASASLTPATKIVLGNCSYGTIADVLGLSVVDVSSAGNTSTVTINGVTDTAPIINSNVLSSAGLVLTSTVNGVADSEDITSAVQALIDTNTDSVTNTVTGHLIATHTAVDNSIVNINETVTALGTPTLVANILTIPFINESGVTQTVTVDLSTVAPTNDIQIASATYAAATNIITLTETNGDVYNINLSEFSIITNTLPNGDVEVTQEGVVKFVVPKNATSITYDNATSGLVATNVQSAIDELDSKLDATCNGFPISATNKIITSGSLTNNVTLPTTVVATPSIATNDYIKAVKVNVGCNEDVYVPAAKDVCSKTSTTQLEADATDESNIFMVICGGPNDGKKVALSQLNLGAPALTAPVMGGAGTTTATGIGTNTATLQGTYTSDGGSAITATGMVVYPSGTSPYTIGSPFVMQYVDGTLPSPINASPTNLAPTTNYCTRPYATNAIGTSYGTEVCFTTNSVGYVTNLSGNSISIIDLTSFTNTGTISGISAPLDGHIDSGYMYVGGGSNFVTRIYLGDNSTSTLNLGAQVGILGSDATHLYAQTGSTGTIHKISKATFTVSATLAGLADIQDGIIVGTTMYVTLQASGAVHEIDLTTFTSVANVTPPYSGAHRIVTDGTFLYVVYYISNVVAKINMASMTFVTAISGFSTPYGIVYDPVTNALYVGNNGGGNVTKVDIATFSSVGTVAVGVGPRYPLIKSGFLYMPCDTSNTVDKINLSTFTNVGNVATGAFPCTFMVQQ